jgi:acyl dehydratase
LRLVTEARFRVQLDLTRLGQSSEEARFVVTDEHVKKYARATNDTHPLHTAGQVAPAAYAVVPGGLAWGELVRKVAADDGSHRSVHGEHDLYIERPIRPGMTLWTQVALVGVHPRSSGTTVTIRANTRDDQGHRLSHQYLTLFFRGVNTAKGGGESPPDHTFPESLRDRPPLARVTIRVDADQSLRYAEASGDYSSYHLSDREAQAAGFPRIFLHGLCTMAMAGASIVQTVCPENPDRLRRLAVRFSAIVFPGREITTQLWDLGRENGRDAYAFEVVDDEGQVVVKNGRAEVAV